MIARSTRHWITETVLFAAAALLVALAVLGGCTRDMPKDGVLLWHAYNDVELAALQESTARIEKQLGIRVMLVGVPYEAFADKLTAAIPNGNGPDLFIFAHDRIGHWKTNGLIEPVEYYVDEEQADLYAHDALAAMAFEGSLYGLPLAVKSVALFYRTDLIERAPATTDELLALRKQLPGDIYPLVYENTDLYGHVAWLHGFGGEIFTEEGELAIATPQAADALAFARMLDRDKVVPSGVDGRMVATLFNEGKAAMAISGPWFLGDIGKKVPWKVTTLPTVSKTGLPARPFLGAEGVLMSSRARDKDLAFQVMRALSSDEDALYRARNARQVVPNKAAYTAGDIAQNAALMAFRTQLDLSEPMSASLAMRTVWTPYQTALLKVIDQDKDIGDSLREAESEVQRYIEGNP